MQIGDLVTHKMNGGHGLIVDIRRGCWNYRFDVIEVQWSEDNSRLVYPSSQLELYKKIKK